MPWYLLLNGIEPRWRLHDTVDSADLEQSLARVMDNGVIIYTLASRNAGELFQSLTINGKHLVTYVITEEADPDPAKTRSRHEAAGFCNPRVVSYLEPPARSMVWPTSPGAMACS